MSDKPAKTYVDALFIKKKTFGTDGVALKVSVQCKDFFEFAKKHKNEGGWLNFDIMERKTPSEKGHTHYAVLDTWKPNEQGEKPAAAAAPAKKKAAAPETTAVEPDDEQPPF